MYAVYSSFNDQDERFFWWGMDARPLTDVSFTEGDGTASFTGFDERGQRVIELKELNLLHSGIDIDNSEVDLSVYGLSAHYGEARYNQGFSILKDSAHFAGRAGISKEDTHTLTTFVGGAPTGLNQLQKLARITEATYNGWMLHHGGEASITVNFSNSSWTGSFESYTKAAGQLTVSNGSIDGANLSAGINNITSDHSALTKGSIEGTFFGNNASNIGGLVDVTTEYGRYADVFDTATGSGNVILGEEDPRP